MSDVWVLGTHLQEGNSGSLVRADAITHLQASTEKVTASRIGSEDSVVLAHKDSEGLCGPAPVLPEDFHLALLVVINEARRQARAGGDEDLVVLADLDDNKKWDWSVFPLSEVYTG
ncbi:hypothetical protein [Streptomyces sp. NPDC056883]|uniref:hypothetical protein n=1 Tax=Streptomyces sp. NPDC056883 TaxID=3345959 RepID=UPI0036804E38